MREALYYETGTQGAVQCRLCPYQCSISASRHGKCGVRLNRNGVLHTMTYGRISTEQVLPVERFSMYHFHPGSKILLVGSMGCNMRCPFCNTARVSQMGTRTVFVSPEELVKRALEKKVQGVAFGVNEPVVFLEYILDAAPLLKKAGLFIMVNTNGFIHSTPLFDLLEVIDAVRVDFKGFDERFYQAITGGYRSEIMQAVSSINVKRHLEISALVIGDVNDDEEKIDAFFNWMLDLQPEPPPLHLLQYAPAYQYEKPATHHLRMYYLQERARRTLPFVYLSNMEESRRENTICPKCKKPLIRRESLMNVETENLNTGECPHCGEPVFIVT